MSSHRPSIFALAAILLALCPRAEAVPMVAFTTSDLGGGLFQYFLTIDNSGGSGSISGLLVLHGDAVFGLDDLSDIGAPQDVGGDPAADWDFFPPLPALIDELAYFSLDPAGDVPIDGVLDGFFFKSTTDPATLTGADFAVEAIVNIDEDGDLLPDAAVQRPLGNARMIPEPGVVTLLGIALAALTVFGRSAPGASASRSRARR